MSKVSSKKLLSALAATVLAASTAGAQVTFSTTGTFAGAGCGLMSCTFGTFTLGFQNAPSTAYLTPSTLDLGNFTTSSSASTATATMIPANVMFTLMINQTSPVAGSTSTSGPISGSLAYNPSQSSLVFTPMTSFLSIDGVQYRLITDNTGNINIAAPTVGNNPNPTIIKANVAVVPEPATVALMATGLVGVAITGFRRRK
jgi:hypothetical protein